MTLSPVSALAIDDSLAAQARAGLNLQCDKKEGKDIGRCISDTLKQWRAIEKSYNQLERKKRETWVKEHSSMGQSPEYYEQYAAFQAELKKERATFRLLQKELQQKSQNAWQNRRRVIAPEPTGNKFDAADVTAAEEKCRLEKDTSAHRACMRRYLRPANEKGWARTR